MEGLPNYTNEDDDPNTLKETISSMTASFGLIEQETIKNYRNLYNQPCTCTCKYDIVISCGETVKVTCRINIKCTNTEEISGLFERVPK